MKLAKMRETEERLCGLISKEFEFNGLKIRLNFAERAKHPKDWAVDKHYHPWFEFNYVSKGSVYTEIEGREFLINAGSSYLIPPGKVHSHRGSGDGDDGICVRFSLSGRKECEAEKVLTAVHARAFESGFEHLDLSGGLWHRQAEFAAWLMHVCDSLGSADTEKSVGGVKQNSLSAQAVLYMEEYLDKSFSARDIANALNVGYRTLARRFKEETGKTLSQKLAELRIEKAKQMLVSTRLSVSDIAHKTGYDNEFYFSKRFKESVGVPPKTYRCRNFVTAENR